jgi:hypothetical protein
MGSHNNAVPGGPPWVTPLTTPINVGHPPLRTGSADRQITDAELAGSRRAEAAKTWSPSTKPVPERSSRPNISIDARDYEGKK